MWFFELWEQICDDRQTPLKDTRKTLLRFGCNCISCNYLIDLQNLNFLLHISMQRQHMGLFTNSCLLFKIYVHIITLPFWIYLAEYLDQFGAE